MHAMTEIIQRGRARHQEIIDRGEREKLDDARIKIKQALTESPESMYEWLQDNVSPAEADALTGMALWLMLTEHYKKPLQSLPIECFRFVAEEISEMIDAAARKAVE